jgi:hypothetical protein
MLFRLRFLSCDVAIALLVRFRSTYPIIFIHYFWCVGLISLLMNVKFFQIFPMKLHIHINFPTSCTYLVEGLVTV